MLLGATFPLMSAGVVRRVPERAGEHAVAALLREQPRRRGRRAPGGILARRARGAARERCSSPRWPISWSPLVVLVFARSLQRRRSRAVALRRHRRSLPRAAAIVPLSLSLRRLLLAVSFGTAVSSFIYEIGWIRMLSLVLGSATHSFELMLSAFILGSRAAARSRSGVAATRAPPRCARSRCVQIAMGVLARRDAADLPAVVRLDGGRSWPPSRARRKAIAAFSIARYVICLAVMLPATFCAGMTLPLITRLLLRGGSGEARSGRCTP